jgi:cytochrome c
MDLLDKSVLPQSAHHLMLLEYLLVITTLIFSTYTGILLGSLSLSLFYKRRGDRTGNKTDSLFAKDLIDLTTFNKSVSFAFGIVPLLSSVFGYAQLLHLTDSGVPGFFIISSVFLAVALILIYIYKYTFHLKDIFGFAGSAGAGGRMKNEIESYKDKTVRLYMKSGAYGLAFLAVSVYIFIGSVLKASDPERWRDGLLSIIFSPSTFVNFLQYLAFGFSITGAAILFFICSGENETGPAADQNYLTYVKSFALRLCLICSLVIPLLITAAVLIRPSDSLSFQFFGITAAAMTLILGVGVLVYFMIRDSHIRYSSMTLYLLVAVFLLVIIKDQYVFDTVTRSNTALLDAKYTAYEENSIKESGLAATPVNGADIYNGRCIACHRFDLKLVGPPYKLTLPKYEGKMDELVKFILNPVKKNPDYPAMPNQGLKPNEAEAIAKYIMETYKK